MTFELCGRDAEGRRRKVEKEPKALRKGCFFNFLVPQRRGGRRKEKSGTRAEISKERFVYQLVSSAVER